jgi:hypothetical protein
VHDPQKNAAGASSIDRLLSAGVCVVCDGYIARSDWSTKFSWFRPADKLLPPLLRTQSHATVMWTVPTHTPAGTYRLVHQGHYRRVLGGVQPFVGVSSAFPVCTPSAQAQHQNP